MNTRSRRILARCLHPIEHLPGWKSSTPASHSGVEVQSSNAESTSNVPQTSHSDQEVSQVNHEAMVHYLPYDVVLAVLSEFDTERASHRTPWIYTKVVLQPILFAACLVNRQWYHVAAGILYKDVFLSSLRAVATFCRTLSRRKQLRPIVRSLFFARPYTREGVDGFGMENTRDLKRIYAICANLHSKTVIAHSNHRYFPSNMRQFIGRNTSNKILILNAATLTRLEIQAWGDFPGTFTSALSLPVLQVLDVKGYNSEARNGRPLEWPFMPKLRSLCLKHCQFLDEHMPFPTSSENDGLRALEIIGGRYLANDLWQEILVVGNSLELLTFAPNESNLPHNGELKRLPSVMSLRLSSSCYKRGWGAHIFPRCLSFVTIEMPFIDAAKARSVYECTKTDVQDRDDEVWKFLSELWQRYFY